MMEKNQELEAVSENLSEDSEAYFGLIIKKVKKEIWQQKVWIAAYATLTFAAAWTWPRWSPRIRPADPGPRSRRT